MIELETLKLELIDYNNIEHLTFLKQLMESKDINYLWDLSNINLSLNQNKDKFIVLNENNEKIGYLNISDQTEAYFGNTVSIYYAVEEKYRGNHYGQKIIKEVNNWLFQNRNIECVVAQADTNNIYSQKALTEAGMQEANSSDDYMTFIERKNR